MNTIKNLNSLTTRIRSIIRIILLIGGSIVAFIISSFDLINTNMSVLFHLVTIS